MPTLAEFREHAETYGWIYEEEPIQLTGEQSVIRRWFHRQVMGETATYPVYELGPGERFDKRALAALLDGMQIPLSDFGLTKDDL